MPLEGPTVERLCNWHNVKMDLKETEWEAVD
jgi:hypothetical protein